ncbi:MAG: OsmC family protein, partial [Calditrichaeota bacterium]|nr:OsmC family protein [Calditrichota bacterium]
MKTSAFVDNSKNQHLVTVSSDGNNQTLNISSKSNGFGSSVNGGEFLALALASCFCNDLYREAAKRQIQIQSVHVEATIEFNGEGNPGHHINYSAKVDANASQDQIKDLIHHTDTVAEIHNTLRT